MSTSAVSSYSQASCETASHCASQLAGVDLLRIFAAMLVTTHHLLSLKGLDEFYSVFDYRLSGLGTVIFLLMGGFFAQQTSRSPRDWLFARLAKIYPSYWIVVTLGFVFTWSTSYKSFDGYQVVSQLLGMSGLTHAGHQVNTALWFVSAILIGYFYIFLARQTSIPKAISWATLIVIVSVLPLGPHLVWCIVIFLMGYVLPFKAPNQHHLLLTVVVAWVIFFAQNSYPELRHSPIAILLLLSACQMKWRNDAIRVVAGYTFEFYLCHGIIFAGLYWLSPAHGIVWLMMCMVSSALFSIALRVAASHLQQFVVKLVDLLVRQLSTKSRQWLNT
jgi:hypothetical protein